MGEGEGPGEGKGMSPSLSSSCGGVVTGGGDGNGTHMCSEGMWRDEVRVRPCCCRMTCRC